MYINNMREYPYKNPNVPAVRKWLENKYIEMTGKASNLLEMQEAKYRYTDIKDNDIWVEYTNAMEEINGKFLACFSVIRKGYGVADAKLDITTLDEVIEYFNIPVIETDTYFELFDKLKENPKNVLYKVKNGSGKYGIVIDNTQSVADRYKKIIDALNGVSFNVRVNYTGEQITESNPNIGEVVLYWPGFRITTLEVYPLEEII